MPRIQIAQYSQFVDVRTGVAFTPVPDRRTGQYVGIADVDETDASLFTNRPSFRVLTDAEFLAMVKPPVPIAPPASLAASQRAPEPPADGTRKK